MPVVEAKESTQVAHAAIEARRAAAARQAREAARNELTARNADTTTPLRGMPEATLPDPPAREEVAPAAEVKARPQATFTIHASMDGFPFEVQFSGSADNLQATIKRLRDLGATPPDEWVQS